MYFHFQNNEDIWLWFFTPFDNTSANITKVYPELFQTSKMKLFANKVNGFSQNNPLQMFASVLETALYFARFSEAFVVFSEALQRGMRRTWTLFIYEEIFH